MTATTVDPRTVRSALQLAARAPSVHNTQPWKWRIGDGSVELLADQARWLRATDQDGRDLMLSCGAALHHLRVALAAAGVDTSVHRLPDPDQPDLLATIDLHPGSGRNYGVDPEQAAAILARRTDRRRFDGWAVPEGVTTQFVQHAGAQGAILRVVTDGMALHTLYAAIRATAAERDEDAVVEADFITWTGLHGGTRASRRPTSRCPASVLPARPSAGSRTPADGTRCGGARLGNAAGHRHLVGRPALPAAGRRGGERGAPAGRAGRYEHQPADRAAGGRPHPCGRRGRGPRRHPVAPDGDSRRVALGSRDGAPAHPASRPRRADRALGTPAAAPVRSGRGPRSVYPDERPRPRSADRAKALSAPRGRRVISLFRAE